MSYGNMPTPPPGAAPASDNTTLFGVLGIVFGICFWPLGILFSILGMNAAGRAGKPKTLATVGLVISIVVAIISIISVINRY